MNKKLIGIKSSLKEIQLQNKIFEELQLLELHLYDFDFNDLNLLENKIKNIILKYPTLRLMLHCPLMEDKKDMLSLSDSRIFNYVEVLYNLCENYTNILGFIQHPEYCYNSVEYDDIKNNLKILRKRFENIDEYMYIENILGINTYERENFIFLLQDLNIKKVCFDIAHFTSKYFEADLLETISYLNDNFDVYYHISDNFYGLSDSTPKNLGYGEIDFNKLEQFINFGIIETFSYIEDEGYEMKRDYFKLQEIFQKNYEEKQDKKLLY